MKTRILDFLKHVHIGEPQSYENLTVYPVRVKGYATFTYQVLDEALKNANVTVREVNGSGHVPELLITNNSDIRVFLMDGEELIGAKQNRIVNTSIMIEAHSSIRIPVSCVEQGRWHYEGTDMKAGSVSHPHLRNEKAAQVSCNLEASQSFAADQGAIWGKVAEKLDELNVRSDTSDMDTAFREKQLDLNSFLEKLRFVEGTTGVIAAINGRLVCADLFDSTETCGKLLRQLISTYALDALGKHKEVTYTPSTGVEDIGRFISLVESAKFESFASPGMGTDVRFDGDGFRGSALVCEDRVIHLAAFRTDESDRDRWTALARPSRRRTIV